MSLNRVAIFDALFDLGCASSPFLFTSQRLKKWADTPLQPALFLRSGDDDYPARDTPKQRIKVMLNAEFWIFYKTSDAAEVPGRKLNELISNLEDALRPGVMQDAQTLGGLVIHCWIEGTIKKDDGALFGQAVACVPVQILAIS